MDHEASFARRDLTMPPALCPACLDRIAREVNTPLTTIIVVLVRGAGEVKALASMLKPLANYKIATWKFSPKSLDLPGYCRRLRGKKRIILTWGLEDLDEDSRSLAYSILNLGRDKIGASRCSLVLCLTEPLYQALAFRAPDFFAMIKYVAVF